MLEERKLEILQNNFSKIPSQLSFFSVSLYQFLYFNIISKRGAATV
jgi:hypothetical protein